MIYTLMSNRSMEMVDGIVLELKIEGHRADVLSRNDGDGSISTTGA